MSVDLSYYLFKAIGFTGVDYLYKSDQEAHILLYTTSCLST